MALRTRLNFSADPLFLMDGTAFIFRGFYAYQDMARSDGTPTNALFITARIVLKLLREEKPARFAFIMDGKGPNFRHELFPAYKAQRGATPEGLVAQLQPVRDLLRALGLPVIVSESCEADDCIASLAARFKSERPVVIVGADKDLKQCLAENVVLWDPGTKEEKLTTLQSFREAEGMEPSSWPDYQAIIGDSSDNIPGVPGVGPKTASELFKTFTSLEEIRDRFAAVPPKIAKKLDGKMDDAFLYRQLTTLKTDTCLALTDADLSVRPMDMAAATKIIEEYELRSLLRELASMERAGFIRQDGTLTPPKPAPAAPATSVPTGRADAPAAELPLLAADKPSSPQTETAPAAPQPMGQGTLFDFAAPQPTLDLPVAATVAALPDLAGKTVAVVLPDKDANHIAVAVGNTSVLFTGSGKDLAAHVAAALPERLVTPDLKALYTADPAWKAIPVGRCFDLSLAAYLLNPEDRDYSFPHLMRRWAEQVADTTPPTDDPARFALNLYAILAARLAAAEQDSLMRDLEMPLIPVLKAMEEAGVRIDRAAFADFLAHVQADLDVKEKRIYELAEGPFNIRSSQQLGDVLFSRLNLPKAGKTKGGAASTSQEALEKLIDKHPIINAILEYRTLEKLRSTYLEPLPRLADKDDRIHTTFNLLATATGRLSSSNPNLQNIPVRGEFGPRMRACFIASPGKLLVSADYSQVELRILAHMAKDPILTESFQKGEDIHSRTASLLFDVDPSSVTPDQRRHAKTINFGLIYGMGPQKLGQDLGISVKEAKAFIEKYFERLGALRVFYDAVEKGARERGYVTTMAGRRRYIPDIMSENNQLRSQARRQAINARVQGSAADVIKIAMLAIANDAELAALDARLLLQIHDELIMEVPEANAQKAGERMALLMAKAAPAGENMQVPLAVDWGTGKNWNEAH
ncbi:DNA polymerase [uncultured delta proteobacterium]|uniref:DNA polymerase I n=1 Tax=uncultured delta proteobacterium TaxID=34034 RepID=A0A212JW78_9DELT|nr:DNA polymerase [uncultured delta proteobacterium]